MCNSYQLLGVKFIASLNWNLCTDLSEQNRAENISQLAHTRRNCT